METSAIGRQFLSFTLRDESFAVPISKVREVLDVTTLTRIPRMPEYLCGVINLRGSVVPVVDLGQQLGMPPIVKDVDSCIMIMEITVDDDEGEILMGVLTDAVQEVFDLAPEDLEPPPRMGTRLQTDFITAMGHHRDQFLIILDMDRILASESTVVLGELASGDDAVAESADRPQTSS